MTTGVAVSAPILQFTTNNGQLAAGGSILTTVGGLNAATYQDIGLTLPLPNPIPLNSRGEISNATGASSQVFQTPNVVYVWTLYDAGGNQVWSAPYVNGIQVSAAQIAALSTSSAVLASLILTASENTLGVIPINFSYGPAEVDRYQINTGSNDMAPAFTAAGKVASAIGYEARWGPSAPYNLKSPVNWTGLHGVVFRDESSGAASASAFNTIIIGHNGIAFDLATSYECTFNNMVVATSPGSVPKSLFFSARNTAGSGCGIHRFHNLRTPTTLTATWIFYGYGSEENNFIDCLCYNAQGASGMFSHNATNPSGFTSTFVSIATGNQSGTVNRHIGCDYYNIGNSGSQNEFVFQLEDTANFTFRDGLWACANGISYVSILGNQASLNLTFDSIRGEPIGTGPTYGVYVAPSVTGIIHTNWTFNNVTSNASNELVHFLSTNGPSMQRLIMLGCNSLISGLLLSAYNLSDSLIETLQDSGVTGQAGGTVGGNLFIGGRNNINLTPSTISPVNQYIDNVGGGFGIDGDLYIPPTAACTGALTTSSSFWRIRLAPNGRQVTLLIFATVGTLTGNPSFTYGAVIPSQYCPPVNCWFPCFVEDNNATLAQPGLLQVTSGGVISILKSAGGGNFTNATTGGLQMATSVTWDL